MSADCTPSGDHLVTNTLPLANPEVGPWTISFWVKGNDSTPSLRAFGSLQDNAVSNQYIHMRQANASPYVLNMRTNGSGGGAADLTTGGEGFNDTTTWHNVVFGFDDSANDAFCVLDGDWANRATWNFDRNCTGFDSFFIGHDGGKAGADQYDGYIAEVCTWDALLTQSQVESLWTSSETGPDPSTVDSGNVVAYWPLTTTTTNSDQIGSNTLTEVSGIGYVADHPTITTAGGVIVPKVILMSTMV